MEQSGGELENAEDTAKKIYEVLTNSSRLVSAFGSGETIQSISCEFIKRYVIPHRTVDYGCEDGRFFGVLEFREISQTPVRFPAVKRFNSGVRS